ncbi:MAG: DNA helicase RecQ [Bacteroidaceae bacterium]|nr:DNA helicase RecQ [Bacteroidaceae bacterium]
MLDALKRYFGFDSFRRGQEGIISHVLSGQDCLVLMPTGGGKSLCYQLPAILMDGLTVVVSPLISLMKDQVDALRASGIPAASLNSSLSDNEQLSVVRDCVSGRVKLLYMSPESVLARMAYLLHDVKLSLFAIDEAHCVSQWGHDFRPEYTQLSRLREEFPEVPMMALTATADKVTRIDMLQHLGLRSPKVFISSFDRPNLSLAVVQGLPKKAKDKMMLAFIKEHQGQSGIVYCLSRKTAESVTHTLAAYGIAALAYHAGLAPEVRNSVQEAFVHDRVQVVCATIAFGMGIDKSNIRWVLHYNMPKSIENFYQEIGRAGRDGLPANTLMFYSYADVVQLSSFAQQSGQRDINKEKLKRMQEYAEATVCRRRILLNYFGESSDRSCHNCDVCHHPPRVFDGTIEVQKALSALMRARETVGFRTLADILRGTYSAEVKLRHYDQLKTFGAGRAIPPRVWNAYLLQMLQMGLVEIAYNEENHLKITHQGREVLFGARTVLLTVVDDEQEWPMANSQPKQRRSRSRELFAILDETNEGAEDKELFEELRMLRHKVADRQGFPPYIVFSDKALHEMARIKPLSVEAFGNVPGVGEFKKQQYGMEFVATIRRFYKK